MGTVGEKNARDFLPCNGDVLSRKHVALTGDDQSSDLAGDRVLTKRMPVSCAGLQMIELRTGD